jgi:hypothetical protein
MIRTAAAVLSAIGLVGLAGCGNTATRTTAPSNKNAADVRASYYEYYEDERTGNAQAAAPTRCPISWSCMLRAFF